MAFNPETRWEHQGPVDREPKQAPDVRPATQAEARCYDVQALSGGLKGVGQELRTCILEFNKVLICTSTTY